MSGARRRGEVDLSGLVRRQEPLRTIPSDAELLSAKVTGRITQQESLAFKQAILAGGTKIEPTLRAMIRLYAEDEEFRARVDARRRGETRPGIPG